MARTNITALAAAQGATPPRNRALEERQRTESMIAKNAEAQTAYRTSGLPPDWLQSGLAGAGAGWVFGPVPGLIVAGVSALLGKQRRDGIALQAAANAETGQSLLEGAERSLKRLEAAATTDQEKLEAALLRDQFDQAATAASSANPQVSAAGFSELLGIPQLARDEADEIETAQQNRIARERDQFAREADQTVALRNRNESESRPFLEQARAFKQLDALFDDGLQDADRTLVANLVARVMNPGEIITEGDVAVLTAAGEMDQAIVNRVNSWVRGGADLDANTALQLRESVRDVIRVGYEDHLVRNKSFIDLGSSLQLRQGLLDNIAIDANIDPRTFGKKDIKAEAERLGIADQAGLSEPEFIQPERSPARELGENIFDSGAEFFGFDQAEIIEYGGRQYTLEDRGEGRREWVPVESWLSRKIRESQEANADYLSTSPGLFQPGGRFGPQRPREGVNE